MFFMLSFNACDVSKPLNEASQDCINNAKEVIPTEIKMWKNIFEEWTIDLHERWNDEERRKIYDPINSKVYKNGGVIGENINHLYSNQPESYEQVVTDKNGNILGYNRFQVYLELEPIGEVGDSGKFKIVNYKFESCSWVPLT